MEEGLAFLERLAKAWSEGDIEQRWPQMMVDEMKTRSADALRRLFVERNVRWSEEDQRNVEAVRRAA